MEKRGFFKGQSFTIVISGSAIIAVSLFLFLYRPMLGKIKDGRVEYAQIKADIFRAGTITEFARVVKQKRTLLT